MPDAHRITSFIAKSKKYYRYFLMALAAATAVIVAIYFFAPRPEEGYISSHPLAIATTYVLVGASWAFVIAVVHMVAKRIIQWVNGLVRGDSVSNSEGSPE